ncbi:MAG: hypothetical protein GPJ54_18525 [Candidatus Heimdallarchaeota archaeon]|nr:hypothetical protein [Candidatus Heimdallarchaeota archaeon]
MLFQGTHVSKADTQTVWGPANNYRIAYIHSIHININDSIIINKNNLPVTEFKINKIYNTGYNYTYNGYGDQTFQATVNIESQEVAGQSYEYPYGGFPVMLPLTYQGRNKWINNFSASYPELLIVRDQNRIPVYFRDNPSIVDDFLIFNFKSSLNLNVESLLLDQPTNLPMIRTDLLNGTFHVGKYEVYISYSLKTGVLFKYDYLINAEHYFDANGTDLGEVMINQAIEFVVLIPPTNLTTNILQLSTSIIVSVILVLLILRKRD